MQFHGVYVTFGSNFMPLLFYAVLSGMVAKADIEIDQCIQINIGWINLGGPLRHMASKE